MLSVLNFALVFAFFAGAVFGESGWRQFVAAEFQHEFRAYFYIMQEFEVLRFGCRGEELERGEAVLLLHFIHHRMDLPLLLGFLLGRGWRPLNAEQLFKSIEHFHKNLRNCSGVYNYQILLQDTTCYHARMKLVSWNVNGIRAVHNKKLFLPFVQKYKPDIICLQETKALQGQAELDLPDYEEYWNSAEKKGYSGTAIFTKEKPLSVRLGLPENICKKFKLKGDGYGDPNSEGRVIAAEFPEFFVVSVYTPNSKNDLSRLTLRHKHWDPAFLAYMQELEKEKPVIFCGDLNVAHGPDDLANPKANEGEHGYTKEEREGVDKLIAAGFVDTFRLFTQGNGHYSWWTHWANARARNVGWRIDYFFVSKKLVPKVKKAEILPEVMGSDHCPVTLELSLK